MVKKILPNLKIFFIALVLSLPFWWGVNIFEKNLEDFLFWLEMADNPQILTAQINLQKKLESLKPIRNWQIENLKIEAKSAISVLVDSQSSERILFQKESSKILPIASLTKLMTANIILENYDLSQIIEVSKKAVEERGESGSLKIGEIFRVKDLLYPLLMESSNDAAIALAEVIGEEAFVELMNLKAKSLGLASTHFSNPTGLDPKNSKDLINYSTAKDLVKLTSYLLKTKPLIWEILATSEFNLYSSDGVFHHRLKNTNQLLGKIPLVIGGKTGETPKANGCFLLVLKAPKNKGYLINVILGTGDKFGEMQKLVDWMKLAYKW